MQDDQERFSPHLERRRRGARNQITRFSEEETNLRLVGVDVSGGGNGHLHHLLLGIWIWIRKERILTKNENSDVGFGVLNDGEITVLCYVSGVSRVDGLIDPRKRTEAQSIPISKTYVRAEFYELVHRLCDADGIHQKRVLIGTGSLGSRWSSRRSRFGTRLTGLTRRRLC